MCLKEGKAVGHLLDRRRQSFCLAFDSLVNKGKLGSTIERQRCVRVFKKDGKWSVSWDLEADSFRCWWNASKGISGFLRTKLYPIKKAIFVENFE